MMIVDAINSAPNQHTVYFLLTAYIESLRHFEESSGVPAPVLRLPISGHHDLAERLEAVQVDVAVSLETVVPVREVEAVLSSAVSRLAGLYSSSLRAA